MGNQTIGIAPADVYPANPQRAGLTLRNESAGGQLIRFVLRNGNGLTMTNGDYVLRVTEEKTFNYDLDGEEMRNQVAAIADGAGAILVKSETSYRR